MIDFYTARIITPNAHRGGQLVAQIGTILSSCFAAAKKKLKIQVVHLAVCPDCEKERPAPRTQETRRMRNENKQCSR